MNISKLQLFLAIGYLSCRGILGFEVNEKTIQLF
jgi:hypothetical protein